MVIPHILKYDNGDGGRRLGPLIRINEKYRDDKGLLAHEIEQAAHHLSTMYDFKMTYQEALNYLRK